MATLPSDFALAEDGPTLPKRKKDRTHWLYILVIISVIAGVVIGLVAPRPARPSSPGGFT